MEQGLTKKMVKVLGLVIILLLVGVLVEPQSVLAQEMVEMVVQVGEEQMVVADLPYQIKATLVQVLAEVGDLQQQEAAQLEALEPQTL
jgi:hypothetical protein